MAGDRDPQFDDDALRAGIESSMNSASTPKDASDDRGPTERSAGGDKPAVTTFSCRNCGASVTVRYPGHSLSAACESCGSIIDTSDSNFRILAEYQSKLFTAQPVIPLGTRGKLFDKEWECIGFMLRTDVASAYTWEEYLLFNPYYGYRFLTRNKGHWSFVTMLKEKPEIVSGFVSKHGMPMPQAFYKAQNYKIFYIGRAYVSFVLGEFYWKVKKGYEVDMKDFINPPYMLSSETDLTEKVWSQSEYVEPEVIKTAFKLKDIPPRVGVAPNQLSPLTKQWEKLKQVWIVFFIFICGVEFVHCSTSANVNVFDKFYMYETNAKAKDTITSPVFTVGKDVSNIQINFHAPVNNAWLYVGGELVNDEDNTTYPFEQTVEYYSGYDGGESWSEGSRDSSILISEVPKGNYYINMDIEEGDYPAGYVHLTDQFHVWVKRDVPTFMNFLMALLIVSLYPIWFFFHSRKIEVDRWSDSDFSPYTSTSSDD